MSINDFFTKKKRPAEPFKKRKKMVNKKIGGRIRSYVCLNQTVKKPK